jgi:hypothetical protein
MKKLIINADDFGWDAETAGATIALIERGWVTSATIMTGRQASELAMDYARSASRGVSFGLHFNIVDGQAPCSSSPGSLLGADGCFRPSHSQRLRALFGRLRPGDNAAELRAQLSVLRDHGVRIGHLDSHGHLHKFPAVARAIRQVIEEFGIKKVRRPQNLYRSRSVRDMLDYYCALRFPAYITTDHLCMPDGVDSQWLRDLSTFLPEGITEMGIHPGRVDGWRRRETEAFFAFGPEVLSAAGIELISYDQLDDKGRG